MRKRVRKKRRLAEFREYGFDVAYRLKSTVDATAADAFLDRFIIEAIESSNLMCGGGAGPQEFEFYVVAAGRGGATDAHRAAVQQWLQRQAEVAAHTLGELTDAWHEQRPQERARR